jgi:hypothetical protein
MWRFIVLPVGFSIGDFVVQGVVTKDEAIDLLFNEEHEQNKNDKIKALKEQVEFLEGVIDRLTRNRSSWTWTYTPKYPVTDWYHGGALTTTSTHNLYSSSNGSFEVNSSNLIGN